MACQLNRLCLLLMETFNILCLDVTLISAMGEQKLLSKVGA